MLLIKYIRPLTSSHAVTQLGSRSSKSIRTFNSPRCMLINKGSYIVHVHVKNIHNLILKIHTTGGTWHSPLPLTHFLLKLSRTMLIAWFSFNKPGKITNHKANPTPH